MRKLRLFGYWRSTAAYRVRIALNLKGIEVENIPIDLRRGDQRQEAFHRVNPSHLVPVFESGDGVHLSQSLAIIEYLEEIQPTPPLLIGSAIERAAIRSLALDIVADIHPIGNLRVLEKLSADFNFDTEARASWNRHWIGEGFAAVEMRLEKTAGRFTFGDDISLADVCLVPQVYNARRFGLDLSSFPQIVAVEANARELPAFAKAAPEAQPHNG